MTFLPANFPSVSLFGSKTKKRSNKKAKISPIVSSGRRSTIDSVDSTACSEEEAMSQTPQVSARRRRTSLSVVFLHDRAGIPYHRGSQCQAKPNTTAWNNKRRCEQQQGPETIQHNTRQQKTRFIDEALGLPSAVTQLSTRTYTQRKDVSDLYYTKQEMKQIKKTWEADYTHCRFPEKKQLLCCHA